MAIVIVLVLALIGITALLLNLISPSEGVAPQSETGGIEWVRSIYGWGDTPQSQFVIPQELFIGAGGTIWVTDTRHREMGAMGFNPEGSLVGTVGPGPADKILDGIGPVAIGFEERVFIGESVNDLVRVYENPTRQLGTFAFPNPIDIDAFDDRLAIGSSAGFAIINAENGEPVRLVGNRGQADDQFDTVNGVAFGSDGKIYVVDTYNNRLSAYSPDGDRIWIVDTGSPANQRDVTGGAAMAASADTTAPARLQLPSDITVDGNGRLVVVDALDFSISVFNAEDGAFIEKYGEYGALDGQFVYPSSIAYDAQRDWFAVADAGNSRVQIVRIPGSAAPSAASAIRRSLTGPLRACLAPLALLLILIVLFIVQRIRRRRQAASAVASSSVQPDTELTPDEAASRYSPWPIGAEFDCTLTLMSVLCAL